MKNRTIAAMKMASRRGLNPYDTIPAQAKAWDWLARMQGGKPVPHRGMPS
jgi:hypothetical protein